MSTLEERRNYVIHILNNVKATLCLNTVFLPFFSTCGCLKQLC